MNDSRCRTPVSGNAGRSAADATCKVIWGTRGICLSEPKHSTKLTSRNLIGSLSASLLLRQSLPVRHAAV
jgi:hypothetical protein